MNDNFDPAPPDKHAEKPKQGVADYKKLEGELENGLKGSFPASDPPSITLDNAPLEERNCDERRHVALSAEYRPSSAAPVARPTARSSGTAV